MVSARVHDLIELMTHTLAYLEVDIEPSLEQVAQAMTE
jgi:hypothetical protein